MAHPLIDNDERGEFPGPSHYRIWTPQSDDRPTPREAVRNADHPAVAPCPVCSRAA